MFLLNVFLNVVLISILYTPRYRDWRSGVFRKGRFTQLGYKLRLDILTTYVYAILNGYKNIKI